MVFHILALGPKLFQIGEFRRSSRPPPLVAAGADPVEAAGAAKLRKVPGTDVISFDTVRCPVPAEVAAALAIAADWAVVAAGLTIGWGGPNMVSWLATADDPA